MEVISVELWNLVQLSLSVIKGRIRKLHINVAYLLQDFILRADSRVLCSDLSSLHTNILDVHSKLHSNQCLSSWKHVGLQKCNALFIRAPLLLQRWKQLTGFHEI